MTSTADITPALSAVLRLYLDHLAVERGTARNTLTSYTRDLIRYLRHLTSNGITELAQVTDMA